VTRSGVFDDLYAKATGDEVRRLSRLERSISTDKRWDAIADLAAARAPIYAEAVAKLIDDPAILKVPGQPIRYGLMHPALVHSSDPKVLAMGTPTADILRYAVLAHDADSLALLRRLALDRARSEPAASTLDTLECGRGTREESSARAISSVRLVAMAWLGDRTLARAVAADSSESEFVRHWSGLMADSDQKTPLTLPEQEFLSNLSRLPQSHGLKTTLEPERPLPATRPLLPCRGQP
jgi:hypothetical protein